MYVFMYVCMYVCVGVSEVGANLFLVCSMKAYEELEV